MKTKSNQSKSDCLQSNHSCLDYSKLDHSQLNHSMMVNASSIVLGGLMGATLLSGIILSSSLASAGTDATDEITITVPTSCFMSSSGTNSHTAEIGNGQSNSTIGETTITTNCNDNEGFAIYAIGYTGDTLGNTVLTDTSLGSTHDIVTGTATSGNTSNWAMKLSTITSPAPTYPIIIAGSSSDDDTDNTTDYSTFQQIPDDYTKVAYRTSATDTGTNAEGSVLKTTYQAYISPTQSAGTYEGKVKYTLINPSTADVPSRITSFNKAFTNAGKTKVNGYYKMQDATPAICTAVTENQVGELIDIRDNEVYAVAKLADGKCWMTENLNIAGGTALSADDTDVTSAYISSFTSEYDYLTKTNDKLVLPESSSDGFDNDAYSYVYNSGNDTCDGSNPCFSYYSWNAATLRSSVDIDIEGVNAEQSICPKGWRLPTTSSQSDNGVWWKYGDFYNLATAYNVNLENNSWTLYSPFYDNAGPNTIPNFLLTGRYDVSSFENSDWGGYWTSTTSGETAPMTAESFTFDSSHGSIDISNFHGRNVGLSVRCLIR